MILTVYQIDAFTKKVFTGNPAAVCILDHWINEELMQKIAEENNLAETAFSVRNGHKYEIRWFTPTVEVDLCGHATLATAFVLFEYFETGKKIDFFSPRSGDLTVEKSDDGLLTLDFPTDELCEVAPNTQLNNALGSVPIKTFEGKTDILLIYSTQKEIEDMEPDYRQLSKIDVRGVIVSAKGKDVDFVSRFFGPNTGIDEDPVTGSAHTTLTPYWSKVLDKTSLTARQISKRGGDLVCEYRGERVKISGYAIKFLKGEINIQEFH